MIDKNPEKIKLMFEEISKKYDFINDIISFYTHKFIKEKALRSLSFPDNAKILDLCCGSGDIGAIIKKINPKTEVIGVDFCQKMLDIAKEKNPNISFFKQDATNLSFNNDSFDFVIISFGLRNIQNEKKAVSEIYRVLKKDGILLHLDFANQNFIGKIYDKIILFLLKLFIKNLKPYIYLIESKNQFKTPDELIKTFKETGFNYLSHRICLFNMISWQIVQKP